MIAKRQSAVRPRIEVSAFVAVMLALLFAVMTPFASGPDLPAGPITDTVRVINSKALPHSRREDALRVTITRDGKLFFGSNQIPYYELSGLVTAAISRGSERRIYILADKRTKYANVTAALDQARAAGVQDISFITTEPTEVVH